jgi:hypothetical protein
MLRLALFLVMLAIGLPDAEYQCQTDYECMLMHGED